MMDYVWWMFELAKLRNVLGYYFSRKEKDLIKPVITVKSLITDNPRPVDND